MEPAPAGVRLDLRLGSSDASGVRYAARFEVPGQVWEGEASVATESGRVEVAAPGDPPAWALELARAVLRAEWRKHPTQWPRRITRWRAPPEAR